MLEIDGVIVTLDHNPCWGLVDELCDTYEATLELVTRPGEYTEQMDASVERKMGRLADHDDFINHVLSQADEENMSRFFVDENASSSDQPTLVLAYRSVMSQISDIRFTRQQG